MWIKRIGNHKLPHPKHATEESAGLDLQAQVEETTFIYPGETKIIPCGFAFGLSEVTGLVCSRSGMAAKYGVFVANAPGILDSDYIGEVKVILFNSSNAVFTIEHGDRIAQLLFINRILASWWKFDEVDEMPQTSRGAGGLGSTGVA